MCDILLVLCLYSLCFTKMIDMVLTFDNEKSYEHEFKNEICMEEGWFDLSFYYQLCYDI
jgi:hypothetical protein